MGVEPCITVWYSAMTRPRILGSVDIWTAVLALVKSVSIMRPTGISESA